VGVWVFFVFGFLFFCDFTFGSTTQRPPSFLGGGPTQKGGGGGGGRPKGGGWGEDWFQKRNNQTNDTGGQGPELPPHVQNHQERNRGPSHLPPEFSVGRSGHRGFGGGGGVGGFFFCVGVGQDFGVVKIVNNTRHLPTNRRCPHKNLAPLGCFTHYPNHVFWRGKTSTKAKQSPNCAPPTTPTLEVFGGLSNKRRETNNRPRKKTHPTESFVDNPPQKKTLGKKKGQENSMGPG